MIEFLILFDLKISPCEKDTIVQSMPNATARNNISNKLNFHLEQSVPRVFANYIIFFF